MSVLNRQYKFIDLFCGCGGLSLGFKQAGFVPVAGIDFNEYAIQTYQKNFTEAQSNSKLPDSWKTQSALDDLADFLQENWEQRAVFYEDGEIKSSQQFLEFTGQQGIKTKKYITDDDSIEIGDFVLVPASKDNHEAVVEVVNIEYFSEENVPLPIEKTKKIIRKCSDEDFAPPVE